jgi:hypothetical protein
MKNVSLSIPPLPSEKRSRPLLSRRSKENSASSANVSFETVNRKEMARTIPDDTLSMSTVTFNDDAASGLWNSQSVSNSASSPSIVTTPMRSSRVLRYNESIEDFFCLCPSGGTASTVSSLCSVEHRQLCEDIAHDKDGAANDLKKWNVVLQVANDTVVSQNTPSMGEYRIVVF